MLSFRVRCVQTRHKTVWDLYEKDKKIEVPNEQNLKRFCTKDFDEAKREIVAHALTENRQKCDTDNNNSLSRTHGIITIVSSIRRIIMSI